MGYSSKAVCFNLLFLEYKTLFLPASELSALTGIPETQLKLDRKNKVGIPFKKIGTTINSPVRYSIADICTYINRNVKED